MARTKSKASRKRGQEELKDSICGARKKNGDPCLNPAGRKTEHEGEGFCYVHDKGAPLVAQVVESMPSVRKKSARYKEKAASNALEMYMEMLNDPEMLSIDDEIAMLRSTLGEVEEMIEEIREEHGGRLLPKGEFRNDYAQKAVMKLMVQKTDLAKQIAIMVERKKRMEEGRMVSYKEVEEVLAQVAFIIKGKCAECKNLPRIAEEFTQIRIGKR